MKPGEVRYHRMTKNGPLPLTRTDAELRNLEQPEVNRRDLTEQLKTGCRIRKRHDQTLEELVQSESWQARNTELQEM